jgi:hypothetical protein
MDAAAYSLIGWQGLNIPKITSENDQQDAHFFSLITPIKLSSTRFEQIIFHHQEVISVHTAYNILPFCDSNHIVL